MSERPRAVNPGRLRRRLTLAFALTAGIAAAALAAGSFFLVREARLADSRDRALEQSRFNLVLGAEILPAEGPEALLEAYERRGRFETVLVVDGTSYPSSLSLGEGQVPEDLQKLVAGGELAYERTEVADTRYLVTGGQIPGEEDDEAYFFFSEEELWADLADLRTILLVGLGIVVVAAGLAGALVARRTLAPVARASTAAHSLAEGLLDTRLPVESSDEFGLWATSFNEMADALETKITALSEAQARERRFTADVAHELRTPLTAIVNEASLLAEHVDRMPAEARRPAELLVEDVKRCATSSRTCWRSPGSTRARNRCVRSGSTSARSSRRPCARADGRSASRSTPSRSWSSPIRCVSSASSRTSSAMPSSTAAATSPCESARTS